ncbi:Bacterial regulatory protein, tetR family [Actinomadura rubteroloni]|uniref:Bacterial regulatory protein, tetR family n=1 Tax=Actinomadura rubteroloni TaxID=1926885 RepID=A0A2P4UEX5_9ACTN|nr:TetR/AcrR family transcriptional regulator [Actinomadura rubteroloni]POM23624.1 Bacterial regulatory protein, tetR family [Actinomadura rubteroloni]
MAEGPGENARQRLVAAGIRLLERDGPEALNARKLAAEIGASTMAVYTHFGGMAGLHEAIMREAFVRFGRQLRAVPRTDDPVADLLALGLAYRDYVLANPQRYRFMIGLTGPGAHPPIGHDLIAEGTPTTLAESNAAFEQHVETVRRIMAAGRIRPDDAIAVAAQFWSVLHGYVLLEAAGVFGDEGNGVLRVLAPHVVNLMVGLGDDRAAAEASLLSLAVAPAPPPAPPAPQARRGRRPRA